MQPAEGFSRGNIPDRNLRNCSKLRRVCDRFGKVPDPMINGALLRDQQHQNENEPSQETSRFRELLHSRIYTNSWPGTR